MTPTNAHERTLAVRAMLAHTAEGDPGPGIDRQRRRRRIAGTVVTATVVLAAVSGGLFFTQAPVSDTMSVACFARAERNGSQFPGTTAVLSAPERPGETGSQVPITDALALCSDLWKQGALDPNVDNGSPANLRPGEVPAELAVCVMPDGTAAVVPGTVEVCGSLGLANRTD